jgi:hypothetical protein
MQHHHGRPCAGEMARPDTEDMELRYFDVPDDDRRYVLGFADDAAIVAETPGVTVLKRFPKAVLVETDQGLATALARAGEYVAVYRTISDALRAIVLFEP